MQMMVPSSEHKKAKERVAMIAKIVGAAGSFLAGLDPNIAFRAAENAIENNFMLPVFLRNNDPAMLADSEEWMAEYIRGQEENQKMMAAVSDVALEVGLIGLQKVPVVGPIIGATKGFLKKGSGMAKAAKKPVKAVKKEQPWVVREGQEWKEKIVGRAQKTGTPGHSVRSYREAIKASKKDDVEKVFLDRGYNRATGQKIKSNRRPDVIIKTKDGKVHPREVPSKSDRVDILEKRNDEALKKLPKQMRGRYEQIDITKVKGE
jgi:hypothetical protein